MLATLKQDYFVYYLNKTGILLYGMEKKNLTSEDFLVVGGMLCFSFFLEQAEEVYEELMAASTYIKVNFGSIEDGFVYYSDIAPNLPLEVFNSVPESGFVGEPVAFNATVVPLTGLPPYSYLWEFGDGDTSTGLHSTHMYMEAGVYTYMFTATDSLGEIANASGTITINAAGDAHNPVVFQQSASRSNPKQLLRFHAMTTRLIACYPFDFHSFFLC